jgi:hypothetical protein
VVGHDPRTYDPPVQTLSFAVSLTAITIRGLWSPQTDAGVVVQVIITLAIVAGLVWFVRREKALVQLVVGVGMVVLAWYGLRALH